MRSPRGASDSPRPGLTAALLIAAIVVAGALTWQAQASARSHRAAAEKALRDYAMLGADEFARRAVGRLGYYGYYPLVTALQAASGPLPSPEALSASSEAPVRTASDLVRRTLRYDGASGRLESAGDALEPELRPWIEKTLFEAARAAPSEMRYQTAHGVAAGGARTLVYGVTGPEGRRVVTGFEADPAGISRRLQTSFDEGPLLPSSLFRDTVPNGALFFRVLDPTGRELFRAGIPRSPYLGVVRPFADDYHGILAGDIAYAAIDPQAAEALVIGGLPRSRLPFLAALLALTAGLILAAALQLRRERALARLRSEFVSRVSHELRTPLTQIRMFAETLLLDRVRSEEERRGALRIIDRESRRLANLVENVLRFSRGERGADRVEPSSQDVGPLVQQLVRDFEPLLGNRARLETHVAVPTFARVDAEALQQILLNLLDNATKYGPEGQRIRVAAGNGGDRVRISVEDEGPGIPASERERIWGRYYRLKRDRDSSVAGTGIGLAVVADLARLQGGRVWVEDGAAGGSRFVLELPQGVPE
jgi:signal transduction histidine kinase